MYRRAEETAVIPKLFAYYYRFSRAIIGSQERYWCKEGLLKPWEFLIQKEGDRAWLPLEPPSVEVLEGRYQLVVRSQFSQVPIAVTLTYQSDSEGAPQVQERDRQTNKEGLMVVFPYTHLKAGWWNIACDLQGEDGESRSYTVAVKALSVDVQEDELYEEGDEDEGESQERAIDGSPTDTNESTDSETSPAEENIEEETEPEDVEESEEEDNPEEPEEPEAYDSSFFDVPPPPEPPNPFPYLADIDLSSVELMLDRQMVLANEDGDVLLNGMLSGDRPEVFPGQVGLKLMVALYDPQNLELIQQLEHLLILQSLPVPFAYRFPLPEENTLHFILAEAKIFDSWSVTPESDETEPTPLTSVQFSISTGIDRLMEEIADRRDREDFSAPAPPIVPFPLTAEHADFPSTPVSKPPVVNLDLFNIAKEQPKEVLEFTQPFQISASPSIPPQLGEKTPTRKYLQLPSLTGLPAAAPSEDLPRLPEAPKPPKPKQELTLPPVNLTPVVPAAPEPEPERETPPSPIDEAFQSLHLQDKFAERLNELAKEAEDWVDEEGSVEEGEEPTALAELNTDENESTEDEVLDAEFVEDESPAILELEPASEPLKLLPPGPDEQRKAQEVVWDGGSELEETETVSESRSQLQSKLQHFDVPLPTPEVELPKADWVTGETIAIEIALTGRSPNIHVKYWLLDTQTRILLQEPSWIVDFIPEGLDDRRAILQLVVPNGTMEVQFEAIAVEVGTQRESHKASFRRLVVPPNLPELTFEELEE